MIKNFRAFGDLVSVVLDNGTKLVSNSLQKQTIDDVYSVACGLKTMSDEELVNLFESETVKVMPAEEKEIVYEKKISQEIGSVNSKYPSIFTEKDGAIYRKGIELSIPKLVLNKYMQTLTEDAKGENSIGFRAIDNFWMWCSLNPNKYAREELLAFLKAGDFMLTPNGYFVAYRNVNTKEENNKELTDFIANEFLRVKTKLKKSTSNYIITNTGTKDTPQYKLEKITENDPMGQLVGNLKELYQSLPELENSTVYTDAHTGKMRIKVGQEVRIPRSECDESSENDCSRGLHVGNKNFGFSSFGKVSLICLVNPMNVVAVPKYNQNKMRTCAYFPMAQAVKDTGGKLVELDYSEFDDVYFNEQLNHLSELAKNNKPDEVNRNIILSTKDVKSICKNLKNLSNTVKNRVIKL